MSTAETGYTSPMPRLTLGTGGLLVVIGVVGYLVSMINDTQHFTALIPSVVGVLLVLSGLIALKNTKVGVHIGLVVALIGLVGMFMPLQGLGELFAGDAERPAAVISALITALVLLAYLVLGIRSFVQARRWSGQ